VDRVFADRTVLVTGGGSGIGRATALAFAGRGARVVISDIDEAAARAVAEEVEAAGGEALALRTDVSRGDEVEAMTRAAVERFGGVDVSVHSAGTGGMDAPTAEHTEEAWRQVLDVNLTGVWLCMKQVIPLMLARGGGVIVNVASVAGLLGFPRHAAYAASKHGVVGLTRTAALEYGRLGIRINAVCPGFTRTPMVTDRMLGGSAEAERQLASRVPLGRLATPEEIAASIVYAASDEAGFMIGHTLVLDGGIHAA
jgi:NAD(P)-dependent dehydrogenase (short-subunit alcohol dehydrogenase family)